MYALFYPYLCIHNAAEWANSMKYFFFQLIRTPTAIVALVSALIALLAYLSQRKVVKKQNACSIADRYATSILPRMRYIDGILQLTGAVDITHRFSGFKNFTEKELNEQLLLAGATSEIYLDKLNKIDRNILDTAYAQCGCSEVIKQYHDALIFVLEHAEDQIHISVSKLIMDFLNELEAISILMHYNIADEKLIYQSMHQTLISHMKNWYYFISDKNRNDQDRFFTNLIWLYNTWNKRKEKDEKSINHILYLRSKAKRF